VHLPAELPPGVTLYLGAVDQRGDELVATGSRTAAVVATAPTLAAAEALCEQVAAQIPGPFFHRSDIGTAALIDRRVQHMRSLRPL
jgi:phosphoribosylamine-glycine ligase